MFRDGMPFALVDFDGASPGPREEDVGYAAWSPLKAVLLAQKATVARTPNSFKWAIVKAWAQACLGWTWRHRDGIAAGIALRSRAEVVSRID